VAKYLQLSTKAANALRLTLFLAMSRNVTYRMLKFHYIRHLCMCASVKGLNRIVENLAKVEIDI